MSKKHWKNVDLTLKFSTASDRLVEETDAPLSDVNTIRSSLPTKTNATRQTAELDNISENGPFILNFANISFDANENNLKEFFGKFSVIGIELNNRRRGSGHVEFTNINDLTEAWKMNDRKCLGRSIRLSIPLKDDIARQQTVGYKQRYQTQTKSSTFDVEESSNWRVKKPQTISEKESTASNKEMDKQWHTKANKGDSGLLSCPSDTSDWRADSTVRRNKTMNDADKKTDYSEKSTWKTVTNREVGKQSNQIEAKSHVNIEDMSNWRGRGSRDNEVRGDNSKESDNWRKARNTDIPLSSSKEEGRRDSFRSENSVSVNEELSGNKKRDIFGEAKPIDTAQKDLEIEKKLEQVKLTIPELPKKDSTKSNSWTSKKMTNISEIDSSENWRAKPAAVQPNLNNLKEPVKLLPAPPPLVNVWDLRKKSKMSSINSTTEAKVENVMETKPSENVVETKPSENMLEVKSIEKAVEIKSCEKMVETRFDERSDTLIKETKVVNVAVDQSRFTTVIREDVVNRVAVKTPTVISINGPYIDPRSHRTPQHSVSETKAPTAVPLAKVVSSNIKSDNFLPQTTTKTSNKTFASIAASSSS